MLSKLLEAVKSIARDPEVRSAVVTAVTALVTRKLTRKRDA